MDRLFETEKDEKTAVAIEEKTPQGTENLQETEKFQKTDLQENAKTQEITEKKQEKEQNFQQNLQFSGNFENNISVFGNFSVNAKESEKEVEKQPLQTPQADNLQNAQSTSQVQARELKLDDKSDLTATPDLEPDAEQDAAQRTLNAQNLDPNMTIGQAVKSYASSFGEKTIAEYLREKQQNEQAQMRLQAQEKEQAQVKAQKQQEIENKTIGEYLHEMAKEAEKIGNIQNVENSQNIQNFSNVSAENLQKTSFSAQIPQQQQVEEKNAENVQNFPQENVTPINASAQNFPQESKPVNIIEKPNYDLIEKSKTIVKLTKKTQPKKKRVLSKKVAGLCLALTLGATTAVFLGNFIALDQISGSFQQIEQEYSFNLFKYLKNLNNLDATKKSMEFVETYPEDVLNAGDLGQKTNWFDKFCNFIGGLFGG